MTVFLVMQLATGKICADAKEEMNSGHVRNFGIFGYDDLKISKIDYDATRSNIYYLGTATVAGNAQTLLYRTDIDLTLKWVMMYENMPEPEIFAVLPDNSRFYFSRPSPTLMLFGMNTADGTLQGTFRFNTFFFDVYSQVVANLDNGSLYFTAMKASESAACKWNMTTAVY